VSKVSATEDQAFSFDTGTSSLGRLEFRSSPDGTSGNAVLSNPSNNQTGFTDGTVHWIRVTRDVDDGAGNNVTTFYKSDDYDPEEDTGTWTQLGSTSTNAGATSIVDNTAALVIGYAFPGAAVALKANVYYMELRRGINGNVVSKFDPFNDGAKLGATSFTSSTGETWTIQVVGEDPVRFAGFPDTTTTYSVT
jgi:hypothetical protein